MIIYGTRGKEIRIGSGQFNCPRCQCQQAYEQREVKRYFTLYFIPLVPIGSAGTYIECSGCRSSFASEMISYDPEVEQQKTADRLRRLAVLFLVDTQRITASTLKALQELVSETVNLDIEKQDIVNDVEMARSASPDTVKFFKAQTAGFSEDGKLHLVTILKRILESESPLEEPEKSRLHELAKAMGLRKSKVTEILESV